MFQIWVKTQKWPGLKRGKGSPRHGREDEDGVDSDSCGSDAESEDEHVVRPYDHDPKFKSKEELEHFSQGCDNVTQSESDSEEETLTMQVGRAQEKYTACVPVCGNMRSQMKAASINKVPGPS